MILEKSSPWMTVDTALFIVPAGEGKEDTSTVHFTEAKEKEVCFESLIYIKTVFIK